MAILILVNNKGSAREFGEAGNWRRLEHFALPGISGALSQALSQRSEVVRLLNAQSLRALNPGSARCCMRTAGGRNPLCDRILGMVGPSRSARFEQRYHPSELARLVEAPSASGGACHVGAIQGAGENGRFQRAAEMDAKSTSKAAEHSR